MDAEKKYLDPKSEPIENATKNKILDISIDFFSRKGYSGASIRDITKEVGIKESSLYKHFKNKEEILEIIFLNFRRDISKILPPVDQLDYIVSNMTPKAFLERGVTNFMEHIKDPVMQKIWRILYIEQYRDQLAKEIYLNDILGNTIDFLEKAFKKMQGFQQIRPVHPRILAVEYQYPIFTMITEYNLLKFEKIDTSEVEMKISNHIEFFWNAIKL